MVSVIIPTYNRSKYVTKAIDSVLAQIYTDYEIIVVDDGSTDDTRQLLDAYRDKIKYIYQENAGPSAARNTGIRAANGHWIAFLDSDDLWLPTKLSCQMESIARTKVEVCFTNSIGNTRESESPSLEEIACNEEKSHEQIFQEPLELLFFRSPLYRRLSASVISRRVLMRVGCFDERIKRGEDTRLFVRLAFETPFMYIHEPLVVFDCRPGRDGLMTNESFDFLKEAHCTSVITRSEAYFLSRGKSKRVVREMRYQLGHYISLMSVSCCLTSDYYDARRLAWDGMHFGSGLRLYVRCLAVLACPRLVRWLRRKRLDEQFSRSRPMIERASQ